MKRSNRLVLLVGVFLAVIAFVGVLLLSQSNEPPPPEEATQDVVVAAEDIELGTVIEEDMLGTQNVQVDYGAPGRLRDPVPGGRPDRAPGSPQGPADHDRDHDRVSSTVTNIDVPAGYRAMSVMVDQVSGVGTLIKTGDFVDMVIRMDIKPVVVNEDGTSATAIDAIDGDTSKLLLQGMQVLGTLLPPPPAAAEGATPQPGTALTGTPGARDPRGHAGPGRGRQMGPERRAGFALARAALARRLHRRGWQPPDARIALA